MISNILFALLFSYLLVMLYLFISICIDRSKFIYVLIPSSFVLVVGIYFSLEEIKSSPIEGMPKKEFEMLDYRTDGEEIFLWAKQEEDKFPKTWVFPYTDETASELEGGKRKAKQGNPQRMKSKTSAEGLDSLTTLGSTKSNKRSEDGFKDYEQQ